MATATGRGTRADTVDLRIRKLRKGSYSRASRSRAV
jgi:hypothetical protein